MAANTRELQTVLKKYIKSWGEVDKTKLRQLVEQQTADTLCNVLKSVTDSNGRTAVFVDAWQKYLESVKCFLGGLSAAQKYDVLKVQVVGRYRYTALHIAAVCGNTKVIRYLVDTLTTEYKFKLFKIQDTVGDTPLHEAAYNKETEVIQIILECLSIQQQLELLSIKDKENQTAVDILPDYTWYSAARINKEMNVAQQKITDVEKAANQKITDVEKAANQKIADVEKAANQKITQQNQELAVANQKITVLEDEKTQQQQELTVANQKVTVLEEEKTQQQEEMHALAERVATMENLIQALQIELRTSFCTGWAEDQEHEG